MKQSQLFTKTIKEAPKDETAVNAQLLERGGFMFKNSAGIYTFLPLGWRVIEKIAQIIREEMNAIGGQELFMPALVERKYLDATGRWDVGVGFEAKGKKDQKANFVLGWTHEEVLTAIVKKYISSYRDLPFAAYQIQTKFRNEPRATSGLLRGREFLMKDLYSFHPDEKDLEYYYEKVKQAYEKIFRRCGLKTVYTVAAGGDFTKSHTHEFQVLAEVGEDTILLCEKCGYAENQEISKLRQGDKCPKCQNKITGRRSIEVGNIFPLGTKYSQAFDLQYTREDGKKALAVMGSYGIGLGRTMGAIVEVHHDQKGIIWPPNVAPYQVHLLNLAGENSPSAPSLPFAFASGGSKRGKGGVHSSADEVYQTLLSCGIEVLYDDRNESPGSKFADSDLLGIPLRAVISEKTLAERPKTPIELKARKQGKAAKGKGYEYLNVDELIKKLKKWSPTPSSRGTSIPA